MTTTSTMILSPQFRLLPRALSLSSLLPGPATLSRGNEHICCGSKGAPQTRQQRCCSTLSPLHCHRSALTPRHPSRRLMSDNLLGHSPMAQPRLSQSTKPTDDKPTAAAPTGGVWAQTSAKREKLAELRVSALNDNHKTLDQAATPQQQLDLWLADGIQQVVHAVDGATFTLRPIDELDEFLRTLDSTEQQPHDDAFLTQPHYHEYLRRLLHIVSPPDALPASATQYSNTIERTKPALRYLRDIQAYTPDSDDHLQADIVSMEAPFQQCIAHYRLLLIKHALEFFLSPNVWNQLTAVSDATVDRAAVSGNTVVKSKLSLPKFNAVLRSYAQSGHAPRVFSLWSLFAPDEDMLLEQEEMERIVYLSMKPVEASLREFFKHSVDIWSVRDHDFSCNPNEIQTGKKKKGWTARRAERKAQKLLLKLFDRAIQNHFEVQVETPHRLRCIYAWADKTHQNGKVESVLIDDATGGGRNKRYVELHPKLSYQEFRTVQLQHFPQLDNVAEEIVTSFKEDVWVHQGKGRQNAELKKECFLFLSVVCLLDVWITMG